MCRQHVGQALWKPPLANRSKEFVNSAPALFGHRRIERGLLEPSLNPKCGNGLEALLPKTGGQIRQQPVYSANRAIRRLHDCRTCRVERVERIAELPE